MSWRDKENKKTVSDWGFAEKTLYQGTQLI